MRVTAIVLSLLAGSEAWNLPSPSKVGTELRKGCATAALCAAALAAPTTALAAPDTADTTFKVNIDTPYLLDLVKTGNARSQSLQRGEYIAESIKSFLGPAVKVEIPSDISGVAKKALSGGATVNINGQDVGVQVVGSEKGYLTIQLSNKLLPAIPFAGLDSTPWLVDQVADKASKAAPVVVDTAVNVVTKMKSMQQKSQEPFWDRPINDGKIRLDIDSLSLHKAITPKDIVGGSSLGLGIVYAASYGYYRYSAEQEEKEAAERQKAAAAKRAAATAKKKEAEAKKKQAELEKKTAEVIPTPELFKAKENGATEAEVEKEKETAAVVTAVIEPEEGKRSKLKFWKK